MPTGLILRNGAVAEVKFDETFTVPGHLVVDTNALVVDATNNRVGIGTDTPNHTVDIAGQVRIQGGNSLSFGGTGVGDADVNLARTDVNTVTLDGSITVGASVFHVNSGDKRVGVGTTAPEYLLHVQKNSAISTEQAILNTAGDANLHIGHTPGTRSISLRYRQDLDVAYLNAGALTSALHIFAGNAGQIQIYSGTGINLSTTANGNIVLEPSGTGLVGIKTALPHYDMDVNGGTRIRGGNKLFFGGSWSGDADVNLYRADVDLLKTDDTFETKGLTLTLGGGGVITFADGTTQATAGGGGGGGPWATSGNDAYNTNTGNIGIGKANPTTKLDVSGVTSTKGLLLVGEAAAPIPLTETQFDYVCLAFNEAAGATSWQNTGYVGGSFGYAPYAVPPACGVAGKWYRALDCNPAINTGVVFPGTIEPARRESVSSSQESVTVSLWFKPRSLPATDPAVLICKTYLNNEGWDYPYASLMISYRTDGAAEFHFKGTNSSSAYVSWMGPLNLNEWNFLALTVDIYGYTSTHLNGVNSPGLSIANVDWGTHGLWRVGAAPTGAGIAGPDGLITHVRVSRARLSSDLDEEWYRGEALVPITSFKDVNYSGYSNIASLVADSEPGTARILKLLGDYYSGKPEGGIQVENYNQEAWARITCVDGNLINDGEIVTIQSIVWSVSSIPNRVWVTKNFEFDKNSSVTPGNIAVPITDGDSASAVATALHSAITTEFNSYIYGWANSPASGSISLVRSATTLGAKGNIPITTTVGNAGFKVDGFNNGSLGNYVRISWQPPPAGASGPTTIKDLVPQAYKFFNYREKNDSVWTDLKEGLSSPGTIQQYNNQWSINQWNNPMNGGVDLYPEFYDYGSFSTGDIEIAQWVSGGDIEKNGDYVEITDLGVPTNKLIQDCGITARGAATHVFEFVQDGFSPSIPGSIQVTIQSDATPEDIASELYNAILNTVDPYSAEGTRFNSLFLWPELNGTVITLHSMVPSSADIGIGAVTYSGFISVSANTGTDIGTPASVELLCNLTETSRIRFDYRLPRTNRPWYPIEQRSREWYDYFKVEVFNQRRVARGEIDNWDSSNYAVWHVPVSDDIATDSMFISPTIPAGYNKIVISYSGLQSSTSVRVGRIEIEPVAEEDGLTFFDDFHGSNVSAYNPTTWTLSGTGTMVVSAGTDQNVNGYIRLVSDMYSRTALIAKSVTRGAVLGTVLEARIRIQVTEDPHDATQAVYIGFGPDDDRGNFHGFFCGAGRYGDYYWHYGTPGGDSVPLDDRGMLVRGNKWYTLRVELTDTLGEVYSLVYIDNVLVAELAGYEPWGSEGIVMMVEEDSGDTGLDVDYIRVKNMRRRSGSSEDEWRYL